MLAARFRENAYRYPYTEQCGLDMYVHPLSPGGLSSRNYAVLGIRIAAVIVRASQEMPPGGRPVARRRTYQRAHAASAHIRFPTPDAIAEMAAHDPQRTRLAPVRRAPRSAPAPKLVCETLLLTRAFGTGWNLPCGIDEARFGKGR